MKLGRFASLAAQVEPELLRALRLEFLPGADVSAEGDLWFSEVVDVRGSTGLSLSVEALPLLRRWPDEGLTPVALVAEFIARAHGQADPLILLEERVIVAALMGQTGQVDKELHAVTAAILDQPRRAIDLSAWALRVLPRLPAEVRDGSAFWTLTFAAQARLEGSAPALDQVPAPAVFEFVFPVLPEGRDTAVVVERYGDVMRFRQALDLGESPVHVPPTKPVVIRASSALPSDVIAIPEREWVTLPVQGETVEIRAIDGRRYQLQSAGMLASDAAIASTDIVDRRALVVVHSGDVETTGYLIDPETVVTPAREEFGEPGQAIDVRIGGLLYEGRPQLLDTRSTSAILMLDSPVLAVRPIRLTDSEQLQPDSVVDILLGDGSTLKGHCVQRNSDSHPLTTRVVVLVRDVDADSAVVGAIVLAAGHFAGHVESLQGSSVKERQSFLFVVPASVVTAAIQAHRNGTDPDEAVPTAQSASPAAADVRPTQSVDSPPDLETALAEARAAELLRKLEANADAEVMTAVSDRETSIAQSYQEDEPDGRPWWKRFSSGGGKFSNTDILGWTGTLFHMVDARKRHPIVRPTLDEPETLSNTARIALVGGFGTGMYGAPVIAKTLENQAPFDLLVHLGGVFYSGTEDETRKRFLECWPRTAGRMSRALNGNHEMYSGGDGYFELTLPTFHQAASYFAFANDFWLLVGLDTGYVDQSIDDEQLAWFERVLKHAKSRKVIVMAHHALLGELGQDKTVPLTARLAPILQSKLLTAWISAWEHQCILFDPHPMWGLSMRTAGHGGLPATRLSAVRSAKTEQRTSSRSVVWKRLGPTRTAPSCLVLDGPNPYVPARADYAPHGFMTLTFDGPKAEEQVCLADGTVVWMQDMGNVGRGSVAS